MANHRTLAPRAKQEIYHDITENCDALLQILQGEEASNDTAEGRMIYQCRWLKEQVSTNKLSLPVDEGMLATLSYVYVNGDISHLGMATEKGQRGAKLFMKRLIRLAEKAQLLLKPAYYPYALRMIEALSNRLTYAPRPLNQYEQGLIGELATLNRLLADGEIEPPLMSYLPEYPNFREVRSFAGNSIDDLPDGKYLCETVADLLFNGVRPGTWLTPEDADRHTRGLAEIYRPGGARHG